MIWAAIRYRRVQAIALAALSALITACAVFAPLYERALEQSLLRDALVRNNVAATSYTASTDAQLGSARVLADFGSLPAYDSGHVFLNSGLRIAQTHDDALNASIFALDDSCGAVTIVDGRCPEAPGEVLTTPAAVAANGWKLGTDLTAFQGLGSDPTPPPIPLKLVGVAAQKPGPLWLGAQLGGRQGTTPAGANTPPLADNLLTIPSTFDKGWKAVGMDVTWFLDRDRVTLETLPAIGAGLADRSARGANLTPSVSIRSGMPAIVSDITEGGSQARLIVPLLMGQVALLSAVVLGLAAAAAVEQRRAEIALARLRGQGVRGARRLIFAELGPVIALGVPVGFLVAYGLTYLARHTWLPGGVPFEAPSSSFIAAGIALVVGLAALWLVARSVIREPIVSLLRRTPPRRMGWAVGLLDVVVIAVALAGVVTLASGNVSGPLALATPTLLALAVGLALAALVVPVAGLVGRSMLTRGRIAAGLASLQIARRPAVRRVIACVVVAAALVVFTAEAFVVGGHNREVRAQIEAGAPTVLVTDAARADGLVAAAAALNSAGHPATAVVHSYQPGVGSVETLAIDPATFDSVALLPTRRSEFDLAALTVPQPAPILFRGSVLRATLVDDRLGSSSIPSDGGGSTDAPPPGTTQPISLVAMLRFAANQPLQVTLGQVPVAAQLPGPNSAPTISAPVQFEALVPCAAGCQLAGFRFEQGLGDQRFVAGTIELAAIRSDAGSVVNLGAASHWIGDGGTQQGAATVTASPVKDETHLRLTVNATGNAVAVQHDSVLAPYPSLLVGPRPAGVTGDDFQVAGLDGIAVQVHRAGSLPYAPGAGANTAIVSLPALVAGGRPLAATARGELWLGAGVSADTATAALADQKIGVRSVSVLADRVGGYDRSASAWGLQLAVVVGIVGLLIAALLLIIVAITSWRVRARDGATLRMAGVPETILRRAAGLEQAVIITIAVAIGAICGFVGSKLTLPILPFFTTPSAVVPISTDLIPVPGLIAIAATFVLLLICALVVGQWVAGRARLERVRDQL